MSKLKRYKLPTKPGQQLMLSQLKNAAQAVECATIVDSYPGPVMLITTDMQSALQLHDEISYFTSNPVILLPDWETLPYDSFSPHQDIISDRIFTLYRIPAMERGIIILPVNTLMQLVCPYTFLQGSAFLIHTGQRPSLEQFRTRLEQLGYRRVDQVVEHGSFAIRSTILDIYPMGSLDPYRIDWRDDDIYSLRKFNLDTQLTVSQQVKSLHVLPAHEFPTDKIAIQLFRRQWREKFDVRHNSAAIYSQVSKGILPSGIEYWQPLFFSEPLVPLFSYLPANTLLVKLENIEASATSFWDNACVRYDHLRLDQRRQLLPPSSLWLPVDSMSTELQRWPQIQLLSATIVTKKPWHINLNYQQLPDLTIEKKKNKNIIDKLQQFCEKLDGCVIFLVESDNLLEKLSELLVPTMISIPPIIIKHLDEVSASGYYVMIGVRARGCIDMQRRIALIGAADLWGERFNYRSTNRTRTINQDILIRNLAELREGQPVVHLEHGVGRYCGMITLDTRGIPVEYMILIYAGNDKLYVPVSSLHLINRYSGGNDDKAPLHKLGSDSWSRARQKAAENVRDVAAELLDIYAQREAKSGFAFRQTVDKYQLFCDDFPFEPTVDQNKAINEVLNDMCLPIAMDRLVCGDVGFGKTEVAMRAAFLAIENNKQVAVLVPTTLLAQQHFDNFRDRFANWSARIEMISRFRSARDHSQILEKTAKGKVDILIGTHKLLQKDLKWHDLGLLIVDEEHRFGVRHKERIKAMRANVDILTLTATPIPRTLHFAISGMRDLSLIATPPAQRLAVKTFVREYDYLVVREAIMREILRGGQVYYLYNNIRTIHNMAKRLEQLIPEARIAVGHGKMREQDLERVMHDFHHQRFNVLLCTSIIETGIDIYNANTIIIERADSFGLAQLHQLRGRVGRSHHQAYAYLLTPPPKTLSKNASQRLETIATLEDLSAGFAIATHDLEMRGAGEILGEDQSGQIESIGFSLYLDMLASAVEALKAGREPSLAMVTNALTEVELRIPALLPDDYIQDINTRLSLYKRIANANNSQLLNELELELIDRFGLLPDPARYLLAIAGFRQRAHNLGIKRLESSAEGGFIEFREPNYITLIYLRSVLIHTDPTTSYGVTSPTRLKFIINLPDYTMRLQYINKLLEEVRKHLPPRVDGEDSFTDWR